MSWLDGIKKIYDKNYKILLAISIGFLIFSCSVLAVNKLKTGEWLAKNVDLKGGVMLTVETNTDLDLKDLEQKLSKELGTTVSVRKLQGLGGGVIGYSFTTEPINVDVLLSAVSNATGMQLKEGTYTIDNVSGALGAHFWANTVKILLLAFCAMAVVVIVYFRKLIPAFAVILSAISDIVGTLAIATLLSIKLSLGGVAALLMLIGYSVDTDILLSTKMLKREGEMQERIYSSIKTGLTMQIASISAMAILFFFTPSENLKQIALLLIIGLLCDVLNTWIQNVGLLRWYLESHGEH
ncbi:MAG: protein translocase subunit SecF [Candidatus Nanoarchaeia archaeon]